MATKKQLIEAKKLLMRGFAIELFEDLKHEPTKNFIINKFENDRFYDIEL